MLRTETDEHSEPRRRLADSVTAQLDDRLARIEENSSTLVQQVGKLSTWFEETPNQRSLPARVAELETAFLFQQNEITSMRSTREAVEREQVRGYWSAVAAIIAAAAAIFAAALPLLFGHKH